MGTDESEKRKSGAGLGSEDGFQKIWRILRRERELLEIIHDSLSKKKGEIGQSVSPLTYCIWDSTETMLHLAKMKKCRDCYVVGRTIIETIVNLCFMLAKGREAVERAKQHALQKMFRDLDRELNINGLELSVKWSAKESLAPDQELESALKLFTSKKGREITSWTSETIQEQIEIVGNKYGVMVSTNFQFAFFTIYRHASEIAHGTLFGALFALGLTEPNGPPRSQDELRIKTTSEIGMILMMTSISISAAIEVCTKEYPEFEQVRNLSSENIDGLKKEI